MTGPTSNVNNVVILKQTTSNFLNFRRIYLETIWRDSASWSQQFDVSMANGFWIFRDFDFLAFLMKNFLFYF